ncbi:MBL fold metallo-hydrolase [Stratiformator vulcanicus]|uniref:Ribonuclease n=1 Tax=Stratiformator vulcanicus TaxID=2527980 RepID=A0A517R4X4_9PLAN|nr:MBL fold metallo-hydrolase [Stratiformator vulcanicus]QDT38935.1 Ribonuclease [Stratiformator vulcanicus]
MKLTFLGAAGEVTGSQHLVETDELRFLLDCGLFQGRRAESDKKNRRFHCEPQKLDAVFLSHAHIDHCGNLPGLYKAGYRGPIYCSPATADIASIMLLDSAHIQEEDAKYMERRLGPDAPASEPLYEKEHAHGAIGLFEPLGSNEWHELSPALSVRFSSAGHVLGSSIVEIDVDDRRGRKRLVFTGDLGRRGKPLLPDPTIVPGCDVLISECTYGNRTHPPQSDIKGELLRILTEAQSNGGRVVIPAFSLGRTQMIVYYLNELWELKLLPEMKVFVDSPLATRLTNVYRDHQDILDEDAQRVLITDDDLFEFEGLMYIRSRHDSMAINSLKEPCVIISASGMCENGRVRHHLKHAVADPNNRIILAGYQAPHTLGRRLQEGHPKVRIFDRELPLRAKVEQISGLSAHGDVEDLKWWFEGLASEGGIGRCFLVHGDPDVAKRFAGIIRDCCDEDPEIPEFGETFEV